jgi:hypothetical protein
MSDPANLQSGLTVKQAARALNVSERMVYMARRIVRSGRQDLITACTRGELSVNAAVRIIDRDRRPARRPRADQFRQLAERARGLMVENDPDSVRAGLAEIAAALESWRPCCRQG